MGISRTNQVKCNRCGKTVYRTGKQAEVLDLLQKSGWKGTVDVIYCPLCSNSKEFTGIVSGMKNMNGKMYVVVKNDKVTVYIAEEQFAQELKGYRCSGDRECLVKALFDERKTIVVTYRNTRMVQIKDVGKCLVADLKAGD